MTEAIVTAIISLLGIMVVALLNGIYNLKKQKEENESSPYEALAKRVVDVEKKLTEVELENEQMTKELKSMSEKISIMASQSEADRVYIKHAVPWISMHQDVAKTPPPEPPEWWGYL